MQLYFGAAQKVSHYPDQAVLAQELSNITALNS